MLPPIPPAAKDATSIVTQDSCGAEGPVWDLLVIGGGINGVAIARDAAGRGLRVCLCEQDDLAAHTSSASTKLIHGGLRYLEQHDFGLVRHALRERELLLRLAPHIVRPQRFVLPYHAGLRPRWLIRLGLFLYDHLFLGRSLPASRAIDLRRHPAGGALKQVYRHGFEYTDCRVSDARLTVLTAMDARERGAGILTHTRCTGLQRDRAGWMAELRQRPAGAVLRLRARAVVNAAGPWVDRVRALPAGGGTTDRLRFVKGSHLVVRRLVDHDFAYLFQAGDGRVLFAIPFERDFTLLGTTEVELPGPAESPRITADETDYICRTASEYLRTPVLPEQVVWSYSGVRPLYDDAHGDASAVSRDYHLALEGGEAPLLSVYGGKITTHRRLAEEALALLQGAIELPGGPWTATSTLPGGDLPGADPESFLADCRRRWPWLEGELLARYAGTYGTRLSRLLRGCTTMADLGRHFGGGLHQREVDYLMDQEFAFHADDVVWRRTWCGLRMDARQIGELESWMEKKRPRESRARNP